MSYTQNFPIRLTVELENGNFDYINILKDDDPYNKARKFIEKHNLDFKILGLLSKKINDARLNGLNNIINYQKIEKSKSFSGEYPNIFYKKSDESFVLKSDEKSKFSDSINERLENTNLIGYQLGPKNLYMYINRKEAKDVLIDENDNNKLFKPNINPKSIMLAEKHNSRNLPVYERLFMKSEQKKRMIEEKEDIEFYKFHDLNNKKFNNSNSDRKNLKNTGEIMYLKGMINKEKLKKSAEKLQYQRMLEEEKNLTFHPEINEISKIIGRVNRTEKLEDYLNEIPKIKGEKLQKAFEEKLNEEVKECSFHPEINQIHILAEEKKLKLNNYDPFLNLYQNSQYTKGKTKQNSIDNLTFKPKLNENTIKIIKNNDDFLTRLEKDKNQRKEKIEQTKQLLDQDIDPITGEQYFKPNINLVRFNNPSSKKKSNEGSDDEIPKVKNESLNTTAQFKPNDASIKLFEIRKLTRIREIFDLLDSDSDGLISKDNIDYDNISEILFDILKPVLLDIENSGRNWNFEEFILETSKLMKILTVTEKSSLMGATKKNIDYPKIYNFKPMLNNKTLDLVSRKRLFSFEKEYDYE